MADGPLDAAAVAQPSDSAALAEYNERARMAMEEADALSEANDQASALHVLRRFLALNRAPLEPMSIDNGILSWSLPLSLLTIRAREAYLTVLLGQHSGRPHDFLALHEMANPVLPEQSAELRFYMDWLRVEAAMSHRNRVAGLAWALDLLDVSAEWGGAPGRDMALSNMALIADSMGLPGTARAIWQKLWSSSGDSPQVQLYRGGFLYETGDVLAAKEVYDEVLAAYARMNNPNVTDLHYWMGALWRRADCHATLHDEVGAQADAAEAWRMVERARDLAVYQGARSVDYLIRNDLVQPARIFARVEPSTIDPALAMEVLLRTGNSSAASVLRGKQISERREEIYAASAEPEEAVTAELSRYWHPISLAELEAALAPEVPTLHAMVIGDIEGEIVGLTILATSNNDPALKIWRLTSHCSCGDARCDPRELFLQLLQSPQATGSAKTVWERAVTELSLGCLSEALLPVAELASSTQDCEVLAICPVLQMWSFPFAALPVGGELLGLRSVISYSTPLARNLPRRDGSNWAACFDLSLPYGVMDLKVFAEQALLQSAQVLTFNDTESLAAISATADLVVYSGHGRGVGSAQRLLFLGGDSLNVGNVPELARGSTVFLNCCWAGDSKDHLGFETANLPVVLLARGAHSVIGCIGPVDDKSAAAFSRALMPTIAKASGPRGVHSVWSGWRDAIPRLPLRSWASYIPVARAGDFLGKSGDHSGASTE